MQPSDAFTCPKMPHRKCLKIYKVARMFQELRLCEIHFCLRTKFGDTFGPHKTLFATLIPKFFKRFKDFKECLSRKVAPMSGRFDFRKEVTFPALCEGLLSGLIACDKRGQLCGAPMGHSLTPILPTTK